MYTITLKNGTVLKNLKRNGNNFIAEGVIEDSVFVGNLDTVTITDGETTKTYTDMRLMHNRVEDGRSWFVLGEKTQQQKTMERLEKVLSSNVQSITDMQVALVEVYEMILGGM